MWTFPAAVGIARMAALWASPYVAIICPCGRVFLAVRPAAVGIALRTAPLWASPGAAVHVPAAAFLFSTACRSILGRRLGRGGESSFNWSPSSFSFALSRLACLFGLLTLRGPSTCGKRGRLGRVG